MKEFKKGSIIELDSAPLYNHGCVDKAEFMVLSDTAMAICVEVTSCHNCWVMEHDKNHVFYELGQLVSVKELTSLSSFVRDEE